MEGKHTPGPWECSSGGGPQSVYGKSNDGDSVKIARVYHPCVISEVFMGRDPFENERMENKANARLIAASPDLLKALENLVADIGRYAVYPTHSDEMKQARAAIAKAKGE